MFTPSCGARAACFFYTTIETSETLLAPFAFWLKPFRLVFIVLSLSSSSYFPFTSFVAEALRPSIAVPAVPSLMNNLALFFLRLPSCHLLDPLSFFFELSSRLFPLPRFCCQCVFNFVGLRASTGCRPQHRFCIYKFTKNKSKEQGLFCSCSMQILNQLPFVSIKR